MLAGCVVGMQWQGVACLHWPMTIVLCALTKAICS
jgi:hypothetical protein